MQKHLASHLHYDFRLELDGVLTNLAVPKGPTPTHRRSGWRCMSKITRSNTATLKVLFPKGNGGGTVMLWDRGTWEPESPDVDAALKKGDLKFRLDGFKLKGSWALIRTRGYGDSSKPSWLLIKHKDEWAGPLDITEFAPLVVKTPTPTSPTSWPPIIRRCGLECRRNQ